MKKIMVLIFLIFILSIMLAQTWQPISGEWILGENILEQTKISNSASKLKYLEETNICNFNIELDFTTTEGKFVSILVYFGTQDEFMKNGNLFFIEGNKIAFGQYINSSFDEKASKLLNMSFDKKYHLKLSNDNGYLIAQLDDEKVTVNLGKTNLCGFIGLGNDNSKIKIENFKLNTFSTNSPNTEYNQTNTNIGIIETGFLFTGENSIQFNKKINIEKGTFSVWIKPTTTISSYKQKGWDNQIFDYGDSYQKRISLENYPDGTYGLFSWGKWDLNTNTNIWSANNWYHLAFVRDENIAKVFVNGKLEKIYIDENKWFNELNNEEQITIGRSFKGIIDELTIFDKPLTDDEILIIYNETIKQTKNPFEGLIEYWPNDSNYFVQFITIAKNDLVNEEVKPDKINSLIQEDLESNSEEIEDTESNPINYLPQSSSTNELNIKENNYLLDSFIVILIVCIVIILLFVGYTKYFNKPFEKVEISVVDIEKRIREKALGKKK